MLVNQFLGEREGAQMRAEIHKSNDVYSCKYFINGNMQTEEAFPGKSIYYVEDAAVNWLQGIKVLNG